MVIARFQAIRHYSRWFIVGVAALCVGCAGTADRANPIPAPSSTAKPSGCGTDAIAVAKTFVAAIQAGDQSTFQRCEQPGQKLSADMVKGLESGVYLLNAATVSDQVIPPPAKDKVVVRIPAPDQPGEIIVDGTSVLRRPPHQSGVNVRTARESDGSYYVVDVMFYAST